MKKFIIFIVAIISICSCGDPEIKEMTKEDIRLTIEDFGFNTIPKPRNENHVITNKKSTFYFINENCGVLTISYDDTYPSPYGSNRTNHHYEQHKLFGIYANNDGRVYFCKEDGSRFSWKRVTNKVIY